MGKKNDVARAVQSEQLEALKNTYSESLATLKQANETLSSANSEIKSKLEEANQAAVAKGAIVKEKDSQIAALKAEAKEVASIVGKENLSDARGAFAALKAESVKVADLTEKLAKIEVDTKTAKLTALVDKGIADGKILPAERELMLKADISFVETTLQVRPQLVKMSETVQTRPETPAANLDNLDPELVATAKQIGWDPAKIAAQTARPGARA